MAVRICPETHSTVFAELFLVEIDSLNSAHSPLLSFIRLPNGALSLLFYHFL